MILIYLIVLFVICTPIAIFLASNAKECPQCKEVVHPEATKCGACGSRVVPTRMPKPKAESSGTRLLVAVAVVFFVFFGFIASLFFVM